MSHRSQKISQQKMEKQKKFTGLQMAAIGSVCLMMVCMAVLIFVSHRSDSTSQEQTAEAAPEQTAEPTDGKITKEAGAVLAEEAAATNGTSGSGKKAKLKIIEVIPHDICSVFPYMFEWGSKEGYDENTPIGYDGVRYLANRNSGYNYNYLQYKLIREGETREYLEDYNVTFTTMGNGASSVDWWKETKTDSEYDIKNVSGYFEYVGEGKGLYTINLNECVDLDANKTGSSENESYGVRYHVMARERKGAENPKGEWEVSQPQYYWAKDYKNESYPTTEISSRTEYNYDLKFAIADKEEGSDESSDSAKTSPYRVYSVTQKTTESTEDNQYEYEAVWIDNNWTSGYSYQKNGNYDVSSYDSRVINSKGVGASRIANADEAIGQGYTYVWVLSTNSTNPVQYKGNDNKGYFRLIDPSTDKLTDGCYVYKLSFVHKTATKGNYILNPAAVMTIISNRSTNESENYQKLYFEYAGSNKGNYDVVFIYGSSSANDVSYTAEINQVSDGKGRYALTSTSKATKLYVEASSGKGDYSKAVTKIDCAGIDYKSLKINDSWSSTNIVGYWNENQYSNYPGLTLGCGQNDGAWQITNEKGAWVFHTVSSDEKNGYTTVEEIKSYADGNLKTGSKIYVYNQNRKYRYYMRSGIKSTEWFKLLMYLGDESGETGLAEADYAAGTDPIEIVEKYAKEIEEFDRSYTVEIIRKTPSQLTVYDVETADLLYFSARVGISGMSLELWNQFKSDDLSAWPDGKYADDISTDVLMSIYKNCIYVDSASTALLLDAQTFTKYTDWTENLSKMYLMANLFNVSNGFAHFIPGYEEYNNEYSSINSDTGNVTVYKQNVWYNGDYYNLGQTVLWDYSNTGLKGDQIEGENSSTWNPWYFRVVEFTTDENGRPTPLSDYLKGKGKFGYDWGYSNWANYRGVSVDDDERTWYIPESSTDVFMNASLEKNIWKILHNKKGRNSEPVVIVTNADGDNVSQLSSVSTTYYFYVDDYSTESDFDVIYKVNWIPETVTDPRTLTSVVVTRDDGTTLQSQESPAYEQEYIFNAAGDFLDANGLLREDVTSTTYLITATDEKGNSDTATVIFIARETFMLN